MPDAAMTTDVGVQTYGGGPSGQISYRNHRWGRSRRRTPIYKSLVFSRTPFVTLNWGAISKLGGVGGLNVQRAFSLPTVQPGAGSDSSYPLHMHALCNRPGPTNDPTVLDNTVGSGTNQTGFVLNQSKNAPNYTYFGPLLGKDGDGNNITLPVIRRSNVASPITYLASQSRTVLKNVKLDFLFQGQQSSPCTWTVMLVKCLNEELDPLYTMSPGGVGSALATEYYSSMVRRAVCNPIMTAPGMVEAGSKDLSMRVIWKDTFTIQPDSKDDQDTLPCHVKKSYNIGLNQMISWDWTEEKSQVSFNELDDPRWKPSFPTVYTGNSRSMATYPRNYLQRLYVIVRASNYNITAAGDTGVQTPQYDMNITMTHVCSPPSLYFR